MWNYQLSNLYRPWAAGIIVAFPPGKMDSSRPPATQSDLPLGLNEYWTYCICRRLPGMDQTRFRCIAREEIMCWWELVANGCLALCDSISVSIDIQYSEEVQFFYCITRITLVLWSALGITLCKYGKTNKAYWSILQHFCDMKWCNPCNKEA